MLKRVLASTIMLPLIIVGLDMRLGSNVVDPSPPLGARSLLSSSLEASELGITYNHLPKTGGTFAKNVLRAAIPENALEIENERGQLTPIDAASRFTIGGMRNPCEYYVSVYAFQGVLSYILRRRGHEKFFKPDSTKAFKSWLNLFLTPRGLGLMSGRFAFSYSLERGLTAAYDMDALPTDYRPKDVQHIQAALEKFEPSTFDCWIHTENLKADFSSCLSRYEALGGRVDWDAYKEAVAREAHNPSKHKRCSEFYDNESEALVRDVDRHLFRLFNYTTCCEPGH